MVMSAQGIDDFSTFHDRVLEKLRKHQENSESSSSTSFNADEEEFYENAKAILPKTKRGTPQAWFETLTLLSQQTTTITTNFLTHVLSGPKRPSWPIYITVMSTFMQNLVDYTHLADIHLIRRFTSITNPILPSDIRITPISLTVVSRGLLGILKEYDQREDGSRKLDGEWIVTKSIWSKINHEYQMLAKNHNQFWVDENGVKWSKEKVILAVHGGAYMVMSIKTHRDLNYRLSKVTGRRVFAVNYRLAPEGPFPCGLQDVVYAFLYLTDPNGLAIQPQNVLIVGDSAGGGLSLALMLYLRDFGMPLPEGAVLFSPWVDLTMSCSSWERNQPYDILIKLKDEDPLQPVRLYLSPWEERGHLITHPYVSPLYADLHNLPPLLIQFGGSEVLKDEILMLVEKIKKTGTTVIQHEIYEDMIHIFQTFNFLKPAQQAMEDVGHWVKNVLSLHQNINDIQATMPVPDDHFSQELADADYFGSGQSTPTFHTAEDLNGFIDDEINLGTLTPSPEPGSPLNEECHFFKRRLFYGYSESLPLMCDKATSTHDDSIILMSAGQPFKSSSTTCLHIHNIKPQLRIRHFRSTSHPDLRKAFEMHADLRKASEMHADTAKPNKESIQENKAIQTN